MLELINESNSHIFDELVQDYEDEFSSASGKKKNQDGKYSIDVDWRIPKELQKLVAGVPNIKWPNVVKVDSEFHIKYLY